MAQDATEIWEVTNGSTVWVHVKDPRQPGGWSRKKVGGKGTQKITLTVDERAFNQEQVPEENAHLDPFTNGIMIRIHPKSVDRGEYELSDDQLVEILRLDDDATFEKALRGLESEVVIRRLFALSEKYTTVFRHGVIRDFVDDRYKIGKTSKVVKEIFADDAKYADADL